jgi:hypothetical protein
MTRRAARVYEGRDGLVEIKVIRSTEISRRGEAAVEPKLLELAHPKPLFIDIGRELPPPIPQQRKYNNLHEVSRWRRSGRDENYRRDLVEK